MEYAVGHVQAKCPKCGLLLDPSQFAYKTGPATCTEACGWAGDASMDLTWYLDRYFERLGPPAPKPSRRRKT